MMATGTTIIMTITTTITTTITRMITAMTIITHPTLMPSIR